MINSRALIMTAGLLLMFLLLVAKLFTIQITNHEYFSLVAERQQNKPQTVKAERGIIKDCNGEVLSYTRDNISFYADRRMMTQQKVSEISSAFSKVFGKPKEFYKKLIDEGVNNVCLEKKISMDKALELRKVVVDGLFSQEDFTRVYPYGSLASHVLGFVNKNDMRGIEGVEKFYDKNLTGIDGNYVYERDVMGRILSVDEKQSQAPIPGNTVTLTINKTYQKILEEELAAGQQKYGGVSAVGIIMNPNTGEIYALANSPDYDPANYDLFPAEARKDRAITDTYEPGSTMKPMVMSILFENNLVKENEVIDTENGTYRLKNVPILDTHKHDKLTVREVLEQSSNIGMAKLSARIPDEMLYKYLRDFGFSNATAVDLPGEADGFLKNPANFSAISKAFMSFGYEVAVTPLQLITAYCAVINGGTLLKPYVVKSITDNNGKTIFEGQTEKIRTVISKQTSDELKKLMVGVVENGTGKEAQLDNVLVGGKTGTSQRLVNNNYSGSQHNSTFVGFFPADHPQVVCLIEVSAPKIGQYGGLVSAPIFHEVAKRMLQADLNLAPNRKKIERKQNLVDQLMADLKTAPKPVARSYQNAPEKKTESFHQRFSIDGNKNVVPNLVNQSVRDAVAQLNQLGVQYRINGIGKVVWQSLEPGSQITQGSVCVLKCEQFIKKSLKSSN